MDISTVEQKMNNCIHKFDLEGHENIFGGIHWFALCTQQKECKCIDDHIKNETFSFTTPAYNGRNEQQIYDCIIEAEKQIDELLRVGKNADASQDRALNLADVSLSEA